MVNTGSLFVHTLNITGTAILLFMFATPNLNGYKNRGCYIKNGLGVCNFNKVDVMIANYTCSDKNNCYPGCDCDSCIDSIYCNCDIMQCNVIGLHDDTECKISNMLRKYYSTYNSRTDFSYADIHKKFKKGDNHSMFTRSNDNKCYLEHQIVGYGKSYYNYAIVEIVMSIWLVLSCIFVWYDFTRPNEQNHANLQNHINEQNHVNEMIANQVRLLQLRSEIALLALLSQPIHLPNNDTPELVEPVESLKSHNYAIVNKYDEEICTVCLLEIDKTMPYVILRCSHIYHKECIDEWLNKKEICPKCKKNDIDVV